MDASEASAHAAEGPLLQPIPKTLVIPNEVRNLESLASFAIFAVKSFSPPTL